MASFALVEDDTSNLDMLLTATFGEGGPDKAWELNGFGLAIGSGEYKLKPGDRVWIKGTSILVECAKP